MTGNGEAPVLPTIYDAWCVFERDVIAKNTPRTRRLEMQFAFYSGVQALINMLKNCNEELHDDEAGRALAELWVRECVECTDEFLSQESRSSK